MTATPVPPHLALITNLREVIKGRSGQLRQRQLGRSWVSRMYGMIHATPNPADVAGTAIDVPVSYCARCGALVSPDSWPHHESFHLDQDETGELTLQLAELFEAIMEAPSDAAQHLLDRVKQLQS